MWLAALYDKVKRTELPPAFTAAARRKLYFFEGASVRVAGQAIAERAASAVEIVNTGADEAEFLMLQGRPIGEPVAQYGPFVMSSAVLTENNARGMQ